MTLGEVLSATSDYLTRKGVDTPRLDAELILAKALGLSRIELYTQHDRPLTEHERTAARALVERRGRREPLAYVLGEWGFRRLTLLTDARALVPRPETEIVVERALAAIAGVEAAQVVDVGTGSARSRSRSPPSDRTRIVTAVGRIGAARLRSRARTPSGSGCESTSSRPASSTVSRGRSTSSSRTRRTSLAAELADLQPEVRDWEPRLAVVDDGQTEELARAARRRPRPGRCARARVPRAPG